MSRVAISNIIKHLIISNSEYKLPFLKLLAQATLVSSLLFGCQSVGLKQIVKTPMDLLNKANPENVIESDIKNESARTVVSLSSLVDSPKTEADPPSDLSGALVLALEKDPMLISAKGRLSSEISRVAVTEAGKDYQVSGTMLAGLEDISDRQSGLAVILSANRLLFDGGAIDARISSQKFSVESSRHALEADTNNRAMELTNFWIDLNRHSSLNRINQDRLIVLGPLIDQLEKVAAAGIGDVTRVAAAQRTVAAIKAKQAEVGERLELARINFVSGFGQELKYDASDFNFIMNALPNNISPEDALKSPAIKAGYSKYLSAEASLAAALAKDNFNVGLEGSIQKPIADSSYDSDEKIGFVIRRTIYDGKGLESEIKEAEALVQASIYEVQQIYQSGERIILSAQQNVAAMDKALVLARETIKNMNDEIAYLKRQLVIGGSTIDSVLSAEARLYDIQAMEIDYLAEKQKSVVSILSALGVLTKALGIPYN